MNQDTLKNVLANGVKSLASRPTARLDAEVLLCYTTGLKRIDLVAKDDMILDGESIIRYSHMLQLRASGMPVKYITGSCEFMGLDFYVDENVLIPRPDTEILVESVIEYFSDMESYCIIDIGTGSGCIAVSLKHYLNEAKVTASDVSDKALAVAKKNAVINNVSIRFLQSDLFSGLCGERFDCVVSNPPYIPSNDIARLSMPVKYEPLLALDGGEDGLQYYRLLAVQAFQALKPGGVMFLEIGWNQFSSVNRILLDNGFERIDVKKDYSGHDRVIICRTPVC